MSFSDKIFHHKSKNFFNSTKNLALSVTIFILEIYEWTKRLGIEQLKYIFIFLLVVCVYSEDITHESTPQSSFNFQLFFFCFVLNLANRR